ncbi:hypothetical protein L210DRAFT_3761884 [Boletus edulis BED1]|uniref:C2H2-type domain-containing protein n=1 Tax=Boletus edulis BED1 TaxID=1328754 RepID=A0AAD4GCP2_BOLED|nr:hypothetical protein L210DRAFT_3761884 [Boletus edulis BED1]
MLSRYKTRHPATNEVIIAKSPMMSYQQQIATDPIELFLLSLPAAEIICQYVNRYGHECGAILPADRAQLAAHLRNEHGFRPGGGVNKRQCIKCPWRHCHSSPMRRRSLLRHILEVHTRLSRWPCPRCSRTFTRSGVAHACYLDDEVLVHG